MATRTCWSCGSYAEMEMFAGTPTSVVTWQGNEQRSRYEAAYKCRHCGTLSIGRRYFAYGYGGSEAMKQQASEWFPAKPLSKDFPDVPQHIAEAATEATKCLSLGCYRAAGSLARAVVEATAKEKGITSGVLQAKIDELANQGHIRKDVQEAAHEIRHFGNGMAHGDFVEPVTEEDAEEVVGLMEELLEEVFQAPARLAKRKAKRLAAKAAKQELTN